MRPNHESTPPEEGRSTLYATDVARMLQAPIFHVNGEDVDAVVHIARIAAEYRYRFGTDVVVDLIGYRRHGHSEIDDPTITQPLLYRRISKHPPAWQVYAEKIGVDASAQAERARAEAEMPSSIAPARALSCAGPKSGASRYISMMP